MKTTKKLKTTVEGVTLELTTKDDLRALLDAAERLRDILGELETDGTGRVEGLGFSDQDDLQLDRQGAGMRTLTSNELHRLRHIVAEQANDAQLAASGQYLSLSRLDAADVADALEELVSLRMQQEDAARHEAEKAAIVESRITLLAEDAEDVEEAVQSLIESVERLREAVEG